VAQNGDSDDYFDEVIIHLVGAFKQMQDEGKTEKEIYNVAAELSTSIMRFVTEIVNVQNDL
jgi:hypothetical protein